MGGRINAALLKEKKNAVIGKMIKDTIETIIQRGDELEIEMAKKWLTNKYYTKYLSPCSTTRSLTIRIIIEMIAK